MSAKRETSTMQSAIRNAFIAMALTVVYRYFKLDAPTVNHHVAYSVLAAIGAFLMAAAAIFQFGLALLVTLVLVLRGEFR